MVESLSFRRDSFRRGGFTLIEVVVALAIFVFGAIAIIRIFPSALGVIQNSGDRLTATNISRSNLAVYTREPGLVPDIIYDDPAGANYANWRDNNVGSVAGAPRRNNSIPFSAINNLEAGYNFSALGHFKNIVGEKHVVPTDGMLRTQFRFAGTPVIYQETTVSGVTVDSATGNLNFSKATRDSDGAPYVPTPLASPQTTPLDTIYVSYRWQTSISGAVRIWGVNDELLAPPTISVPYRVTRPTPVAGEVQVRVRRPVSVTPTPFPTLGLIDFKDPAAAQPAAPNPPILLATPGTGLSIDYVVDDWRWLTYDGAPSIIRQNDMSQYRTVKLPIQVLDREQPKFVLTYFPTADTTKSMRDNETSEKATGANSSLFDIDPKSGQVTFDTNTAFDPPTIPSARVIYRTSDNWASQLSVAARSYFLNYPAGAYSEPYRSCAFDNNGDKTVLYFQPSEAGKTVLISYSYLNGNDEVNINGRLITINNIIIPDAGLSLPAGISVGNHVSRLELTSINSQSLPSSAPIVSIREIKGASIQSRVAWLDGNNFTQASSVGFREVSN